jgi:hypothetical protein
MAATTPSSMTKPARPARKQAFDAIGAALVQAN